jgi:hypothetical protein
MIQNNLLIKIKCIALGGYTFIVNGIDNEIEKGGYGVTKIKM